MNISKLAGLDVQAWDDAFYTKDGRPVDRDELVSHSIGPTISLHTRHSSWSAGRAHRPIELANNGYQVGYFIVHCLLTCQLSFFSKDTHKVEMHVHVHRTVLEWYSHSCV